MTKIIIFDVGGTLVNSSYEYLWQLLHKNYNTTEKAKIYTTKFFKKEITYDNWVYNHLKLITDNGKITQSELTETIKNQTSILKNTHKTLKRLKELNYKLAILSGGLDLSLKAHNLEQYFDYISINKYFYKKIGWEYESTKFDIDKKIEGLNHIITKFNCEIKDTIFIGTNENDLILFKTCKHSIALNSKSELIQKSATKSITTNDLNKILNIIEK